MYGGFLNWFDEWLGPRSAPSQLGNCPAKVSSTLRLRQRSPTRVMVFVRKRSRGVTKLNDLYFRYAGFGVY